jgi:hypothetical protein
MIGIATAFTSLIVFFFANRATRRAPAWDCGFPDPSPLTQYSASSFAQPIRRVFGTLAFNARDSVTLPLPGDVVPALFRSTLIDPVWDGLYAPIEWGVGAAADFVNRLRFLSIRRYLSVVFLTLVVLLLVLTLWV